MKSCPNCRSSSRGRRRRSWWMRVLPRSRYYHCAACHRSYLNILGISFSR